MNKTPIELKSGDKAYNYVCLSDAKLLENGSVIVDVQYSDGGISKREWTKDVAPHVSIPLHDKVAES